MVSHVIMNITQSNECAAVFTLLANQRGLVAEVASSYKSNIEFDPEMLEGWKILKHFRSTRNQHPIDSYILTDPEESVLFYSDECVYADKLQRYFLVCAKTMSVAESVLDILKKKVPERKPSNNNLVDLDLWVNDPKTGPTSRSSTIACPPWDEAKKNYAARCQSTIQPLFEQVPSGDNGRLILWHGPPGTGKTNAIRSLMLQHKKDINIQYVSDPEEFFRDPTYMFHILTKNTVTKMDEKGDWFAVPNLVIIEDADEFLQSDAKRARGQSVGRLLNLTDGIMGQGLEFLILITTNEHMEHIHPAVARPGRCLANVEFPLLTSTEARHWNGAPLVGPFKPEYSLAELYDMKRTEGQLLLEKEVVSVGQYL